MHPPRVPASVTTEDNYHIEPFHYMSLSGKILIEATGVLVRGTKDPASVADSFGALS